MVVAIYLARQATESRVLIGDVDVTPALVALEIHVTPGELTELVLTLSAPIEINGTAGHLEIRGPEA